MQLRRPLLYRFCYQSLHRDDPKELAEKIKNDRIKVLNNYNFNLSNCFQTIGNFKNYRDDEVYLDRCEIQTRILKRVYDSELIDLKDFSFDKDMRSELRLDSLNVVVLLTQIQQQFTTVFEDRIFETVRKVGEVVDILARDDKIF